MQPPSGYGAADSDLGVRASDCNRAANGRTTKVASNVTGRTIRRDDGIAKAAQWFEIAVLLRLLLEVNNRKMEGISTEASG